MAALPVAEAAAPRWRGLAIDGKAVRGANLHGASCHLVGLVRHADGGVLGQVAVGAKTNESTAVPGLLAGRDLRGGVVTMDALLTQRALAAQIVAQGGHSLLVVKGNQPTLQQALETRTLERTAALNDCLPWPQVGQVLRRTYHAVAALKGGRVRHEVTYGITSLPAAATTPAEVERLWRGHWTIENRVHHARDVAFGEDANQARAGSAPQALAALRNALAHYGAYLHRALHLLHHRPARL